MPIHPSGGGKPVDPLNFHQTEGSSHHVKWHQPELPPVGGEPVKDVNLPLDKVFPYGSVEVMHSIMNKLWRGE